MVRGTNPLRDPLRAPDWRWQCAVDLAEAPTNLLLEPTSRSSPGNLRRQVAIAMRALRAGEPASGRRGRPSPNAFEENFP